MKKVAVAGFGFMGKTHALHILNNPNLELVAIVDKNPDAVAKGLGPMEGNLSTGFTDPGALKKIRTYTTMEECIKKEHPDALHVCVHTNLHYVMVKEALSQGLHVLVEKPFCIDPAEGEELIGLAESKGALLMVAHVVRFMPPYKMLKEWVDEGKYGKLKFLSLSRFSGIPEWGEWKDKQKTYGSSGGALFDLVVHDIDYAMDVAGEPHHISGDYLPGKLSAHDYLNALWRYDDRDLIVRIEGGNIFHAPFPFQAGFKALFEQASLSYSTLNPNRIVVAHDHHTEEVITGSLDAGYHDEIDYFATCMEENRKPTACMPESSLATIRLCHAHLKRCTPAG